MGFQNRKELEKLVGELLNSTERRRETIEKIVGNIHTVNITQKALKNWLIFSPLPKDQEVDKLLTFVPKESTVELKSRIIAIEGELKAIRNETVEISQLQAMNKLINKINSDVTSKSKQLEKVTGELGQVINRIIQLEEKKDKLTGELEAQNKVQKSLQTNVSAAVSGNNRLEKELKEVKNKISEFIVYEKNQVATISQLKDDNTELNAKVEGLLQEIEMLKGQKFSNTSNKLEERSYEEIKATVRTHLTSDDVVHLQSFYDAALHLEKNLKLLGIKLYQARQLAREVIATLASGQLVSLQGSLAYLIAERCAACLTGGEFRVIKVPFGCVDSSLEVVITSLIEESEVSSHPIAVIIEGINRSAFETYGESIRQFLIERIFQMRPNCHSLFLFATVVEGPSMIPTSSELIELGPVISVDSIKWKDKPASKGAIGLIDKAIFDSNSSPSLQDYDWEESIIPHWLYTLGGPLWRKSLIMADAYGRELDSSIDQAFEFVIFGWIAPMVIHLNSSKLAEFAEFIENDERLRFLVMKHAPEVVGLDEVEIYR